MSALSDPCQRRLQELTHLQVHLTWIKHAQQYLNFAPTASTESICKTLFEQLLSTDLDSVVEVGCLPANFPQIQQLFIGYQCLLQVIEAIDISVPREKAIEELPSEADPTDGNQKEKADGGNRMLKLLLSDGTQLITALELKRCHELSSATPPGTKLLIKNAHVRRGHLMLEPVSVRVLGGHVGSMITQQQQRRTDRLKELHARSGRCNPDHVPAAAAAAAALKLSASSSPSITDKSASASIAQNSKPDSLLSSSSQSSVPLQQQQLSRQQAPVFRQSAMSFPSASKSTSSLHASSSVPTASSSSSFNTPHPALPAPASSNPNFNPFMPPKPASPSSSRTTATPSHDSTSSVLNSSASVSAMQFPSASSTSSFRAPVFSSTNRFPSLFSNASLLNASTSSSISTPVSSSSSASSVDLTLNSSSQFSVSSSSPSSSSLSSSISSSTTSVLRPSKSSTRSQFVYDDEISDFNPSKLSSAHLSSFRTSTTAPQQQKLQQTSGSNHAVISPSASASSSLLSFPLSLSSTPTSSHSFPASSSAYEFKYSESLSQATPSQPTLTNAENKKRTFVETHFSNSQSPILAPSATRSKLKKSWKFESVIGSFSPTFADPDLDVISTAHVPKSDFADHEIVNEFTSEPKPSSSSPPPPSILLENSDKEDILDLSIIGLSQELTVPPVVKSEHSGPRIVNEIRFSDHDDIDDRLTPKEGDKRAPSDVLAFVSESSTHPAVAESHVLNHVNQIDHFDEVNGFNDDERHSTPKLIYLADLPTDLVIETDVLVKGILTRVVRFEKSEPEAMMVMLADGTRDLAVRPHIQFVQQELMQCSLDEYWDAQGSERELIILQRMEFALRSIQGLMLLRIQPGIEIPLLLEVRPVGIEYPFFLLEQLRDSIHQRGLGEDFDEVHPVDRSILEIE